MYTAGDILSQKGRAIRSVAPSDTVLDALRVMAEHDVGAVLVLEGDKLVGLLSERDYARKVVLKGRSSRESAVAEVMSTHVVCVAPQRTIDECMGIMTERRLRHLPVVEHKHVVGVVSIGDLVKATIAEQAFTINQLRSYIAG